MLNGCCRLLSKCVVRTMGKARSNDWAGRRAGKNFQLLKSKRGKRPYNRKAKGNGILMLNSPRNTEMK